MLYTHGQAITFIEKVFGEGKFTNGGLNISVLCPVCLDRKGVGYSKKKLVIRTDSLISHCWACNTKARNLLPWIKRWHPCHLTEYISCFLQGEQLTEIEPEDIEEKNLPLMMPTGFDFLYNSTDKEAWKAKKYLRGRGTFAEKDYWYWKFGIATNSDLFGRIIIPSFDCDGNINYWTARSYDRKAFPKYMNPSTPRESVIFNEINLDWTKPITLVEGPFDLLKCNENATCLLGSSFGPDYLLFRKIVENETPVIMALDEDAKEKTLNISKLLVEYGVTVRILSVSKEKGDVGNMTKKEFQELESKGTLFTRESYLLQKIRLLFGEQ